MVQRRKALGLKTGVVRLAPHSRQWGRLFRREAARVGKALGRRALAIEHIGSTAVPGLKAKPIIDIAVAVVRLRGVAACVRLLAGLGYHYLGEYGLRGRHFFRRGNPTTHHVHVVTRRSRHWRRWIAFRDYLRAHPETAREYDRIKGHLAVKHAANRDAYTAGKTRFVERVLRRAGRSRKP